jgi:DNA processing protein
MDRLLPWFALRQVPGIGNLLFKRLIDEFEVPERILAAPVRKLAEVKGMTGPLAQKVASARPGDGIKRELDRLEQTTFSVVTLTDAAYPPLLLEIADPPPFIYVYGQLQAHARAMAVVGSRHPTAYGKTITRRLCADLAGRGITVVSGMALGIDTAAHQGALDGNGTTVAVMGSGLARIYPPENTGLFHRIAETGAVISEFALNAGPDRHHFPMRNRVISGMSLGTVVAEATRKSGSLITARLAAEQNREVFAVPGSVQSFKSTGTHQLIREGAHLVAQVRDILDELPPLDLGTPGPAPAGAGPAKKRPTLLSESESRVFAALEAYPVHIDDLARGLDMAPGSVSGILLQLELLGLVRQEAGGRFALEDPE